MDARYVSTLGRHLPTQRDLGLLPYGTRFRPESINPLTGQVYPDTFLRPLPGYNAITHREANGSSYYHSLQASANRRFSGGLQFGASYTLSKAMDYGTVYSLTSATLPTYLSPRFWSFGKSSFDQTHMLSFNYTYSIPALSKLVQPGAAQGILHQVFDNWEISGVTTFASGTPANIELALTDGADLTGGDEFAGRAEPPGAGILPVGARPILTGDPRISRGERGFDRMFNPAVFARPARGDYGNVGNGIVRNPGIVNWDMTLFKRIPLRSEQRSIELRWEFYNLFNDTQFLTMNRNATFNAAGVQTNTSLGQAIANRSPRIMQVAVRFRF